MLGLDFAYVPFYYLLLPISPLPLPLPLPLPPTSYFFFPPNLERILKSVVSPTTPFLDSVNPPNHIN